LTNDFDDYGDKLNKEVFRRLLSSRNDVGEKMEKENFGFHIFFTQ
jgi:hypothetical protein